MAFSDVMQSLGRFIGLYSDGEPVREDVPYDTYGQYGPNEQYDPYGQPEMDYEPEPVEEEMTYQSGYGSGASYVRAGARPMRPSAGRRAEGQGVERGRQPQARQAPPRQPQPRPVQYVPDNVIRMPEREQRGAPPPPQGQQGGASSTIIFCVRRKDDSSQIINYLIRGVNVILNFEEVDDVQCQRVLDMVSGAAYALRASVERISHRNYLVAPTGVEIVRGETQGRETRETRDMRDMREMREAREAREARDEREDFDVYEAPYAARY